MNDNTPKLRGDLEFIPVQVEGRPLVLIRDHLGLIEEGRAVPTELYQFFALLDGSRTVPDLQAELMRQSGGELISQDEIKTLLSRLDASNLIESERFLLLKSTIIEAYTAEKTRACALCGRAYPNERDALETWLDDLLKETKPDSETGPQVKALIAPHIDPNAGLDVYASAYNSLKGEAYDRVIILGVGHQMEGALYSLTDKTFQTPLGSTDCDVEAVDRLRRAAGRIADDNDFAHRMEHSIEFQLLFLNRVLKNPDFSIVPILCGFLKYELPEYTRESFKNAAAPFLSELKRILQDPEHRTLVVAGVDFSHVGLKFGHGRGAEHMETSVVAHDQALMERMVALDADEFWAESIRVDDEFNVCGFSAMATLLEILPPLSGKILGYRLQHEKATQSAVSFAALSFS